MGIRGNVRRRRRERIVQLLGRLPAEARDSIPAESAAPPEPARKEVEPPVTEPDRPTSDPDPEKWWKEQQKRLHHAGPVWAGAGRLEPSSNAPGASSRAEGGGPGAGKSGLYRFAKGFALRIAAAAVIYGAAWGWFNAGVPGSGEARSWAVGALTRDMDFQAVSAWYEQTFGGSPSFLPMFRSAGESQAVSGTWKRNEAVLPVDGRLVSTFAQDGSGVRLAAREGTAIRAVYAGRVLQVAAESEGRATVLIQHAGRVVTIYGNVDTPDVSPNDWVEAGQRIGTVPAPRDEGGESLLYLAVKKDGKTLDPAEVVPFD